MLPQCDLPHTGTELLSATYQECQQGLSAPRADAQAHGPSDRDMKDGNMKTLITAVALAIASIAAPAITQSALAASPNDVIVNGKNIGTDPDANVRYQMRRDVGSEGF